MPPLTPSRIRAIGGCYGAGGPGSGRGLRDGPLGAVLVLELALGKLLERDREVVARPRLDHRRRELLVGALTKGAVVAVELASALRRHQHGRVMRVRPVEKLVDTRLDHRRGSVGHAGEVHGALEGNPG